MKVVQFLASKGWGGLENVFVSLCNELSKTVEIDVIVFQGSVFIDKFDKNVRIHTLFSNPSRFNPLLYKELYTLIQKLEPDLVHTHGAKTTQIFYYLNRFLDVPHIATKHNSRKGKIFNRLQNVIAVSKGVKDSINHDNVKVIYNGVNPVEVYRQNKDNLFTLLVVGRLDKIKGLDILIKECAKLDFAYRLQIVGEGEERKNLEHLISGLGLEEKISLLGFRKDIPQLMKNADIVVMSSHSEGFSVVMVESLFYANLFISTKVSGTNEVLDERFLFDGFNFSQKLNDVYLNYATYKEQFATLTEEIRDRFILSRISDEHLSLYQNILIKDSK